MPKILQGVENQEVKPEPCGTTCSIKTILGSLLVVLNDYTNKCFPAALTMAGVACFTLIVHSDIAISLLMSPGHSHFAFD